MTVLSFVKDALAVYRITRLVIQDEIAADLRDRVFERYNPAESKLGFFLTCPWCVSVWAGLGVVAARRFAPKLWDDLSTALAVSAVTGLIEERL
jgi:hypothetical protein